MILAVGGWREMSIASTGFGKHERGPLVRQTYCLEEVAQLLGIGRNQAYEAARRGDFPTIRIGKRIVAPKAPIDRLLNGEAP
jgi:hypothetical protein